MLNASLSKIIRNRENINVRENEIFEFYFPKYLSCVEDDVTIEHVETEILIHRRSPTSFCPNKGSKECFKDLPIVVR